MNVEKVLGSCLHHEMAQKNSGSQAHMPPSISFIINHVYGPVLWRGGGRGKLSPVDNETNKTPATKQQLKIT